MGLLDGILETLGPGIASAGMGMVMGKYNDQRQLNQQQKLQDMQIVGQKQMGDYNYAKQLQMWKDTNYGPQMAELEKAGLNPGLIYKGGGPGGMSVGSGGGSGPTGGQAPSGGGEIGMAMQLALMKAQMENIKADTAKKEAEKIDTLTNAEYTQGAKTTNTGTDTTLKTNQATEVDLRNAIENYKQTVKSDGTNSEDITGSIAAKDAQARVIQETEKALGEGLKNKLTTEQTAAVIAGVKQGWRDLEIKNYLAEKGVENKDQDQILGAISTILNLVGGGVIGHMLKKMPALHKVVK